MESANEIRNNKFKTIKQNLLNKLKIVKSDNSKKKISVTHLYHKLPCGVNAGTLVEGRWITRNLNTIEGGANVKLNNDNTFTLKPGTYIINAICPAYGVKNHKARLFNVTKNITSTYGNSAYSALDCSQTDSIIYHYIENIKIKTIFRLDHKVEMTQVSSGQGLATNFTSDDEIYTQVQIIKLD